MDRGSDHMSGPTAHGLDGIIVADTELSDVDGERGELTIRGLSVEAIVGRYSFEDVCGLLWNGMLPSAQQRTDIARQLGQGRVDAFALIPALGNALLTPDSMSALRTAVSHLSYSRDHADDRVRITAAVPVFAAAWSRLPRGDPPR